LGLQKASGMLYTHLRRHCGSYRKRGASKENRGIIKSLINIEKRPLEVQKRNRFGDFEVGLIIGKNHQHDIVTINYRASGMLKMKKTKNNYSVSKRDSYVILLCSGKLKLKKKDFDRIF
jgi:IS30 family transposase